MNIEALRIGNWVHIGYLHIWEPGDYTNYYKHCGENDAVEPIPITIELLEKFSNKDPNYKSNYYLDEIEDYHDSNYNYIQIDHEGKFTYVVCEFASGHDGGYWVDVNYIHEIQNLYYSLTGKELAILNI